MSDYNNRKTTGMTLLRHLATRSTKCKKRNPNGVIGITVGDADAIILEYKNMKKERDEALRLLGLRCLPIL